jgi:hypothetical protein
MLQMYKAYVQPHLVADFIAAASHSSQQQGPQYMTGTQPLNEPNHLQTDIEDQLQEQPTRNKRFKDVLMHQASHLNHFISSAKVSAIMNTF